jgi:hypothetical protein
MIGVSGVTSLVWEMKRLAVIGMVLGLVFGLASVASASHSSARATAAKTKKKRKKCKANWAFKKGKCRRVKGPHYPPADNSPRDVVRATVTWQGNANLDLIVTDQQNRVAGYSSSAGAVVNEIPDATHEGDVGAGGGTERFVDHAWHPNPFATPNRGFSFGACARDVMEPVTATLTFVGMIGGEHTTQERFDPPGTGSGATTLCLAYWG